jgi:hypothetical protein
MWRDKADILKPDPRFGHMVRGISPQFGPIPITIQDMYGDVEKFTLREPLPEEVRQQFDIGRNAYVYSYFEYDLMTLAEMRAFASFELAIRSRATKEQSGLKPKTPLQLAINHARARGWLKDEDFGFIPTGAKPLPFIDAMVMQRNHLMHGNPYLYQNGTLTAFQFCYDAITRLFPSTAAAKEMLDDCSS